MARPTASPFIADRDIVALCGEVMADRGLAYARDGRVSGIEWSDDPATGGAPGISILEGYVQGSEDAPYLTTVVLREAGRAQHVGTEAFRPSHGGCDCPVGHDCKHVAALLFASSREARIELADAPIEPARPGRARRAADAPADWRAVVGSLIRDDASGVRGERAVPLAIGVTVLTGFGGFGFSRFGASEATVSDIRKGAQLAIAIRPLRAGASRGWVRGSLTWSDFRYPGTGEFWERRAQALLGQIARQYVAQQPFERQLGDLLRLDEFDGSSGWDLLARASEAGVPLIGTGPLDEVALDEPGTLRLGVSRARSGDLTLQATVAVDGEPVAGARPIGSAGVAVFTPASRGKVSARLVPLASPTPEQMTALLASSGSVTVPAADADELLLDMIPQLPATVDVVGSAGEAGISREAPPPVLRLDIRHPGADPGDGGAAAGSGSRRGVSRNGRPDGDQRDDDRRDSDSAQPPEGRTTLTWSWLYRAPRRSVGLFPLRTEKGRDAEHEALVLSDVARVWDEGIGPLRDQSLDADAAAALVLDVVPALERLPHVQIVEHGGRPVTAVLDGEPRLTITQVEQPNSRATDWFDLGFEITIDGQLVPFSAIFEALSTGRKGVWLPDRTYARLTHPMFDRLRDLIAEAEAMNEWEPGSMRVSPYQVTMWDDFEDLAHESTEAVAWRDTVGALRDLDRIPVPELPIGLEAQLRPYQIDGFAWIDFLRRHALGGILADDMGLGKTVQALAAIAKAREKQHDEAGIEQPVGDGSAASDADGAAPPFLVVAPSSVLSVWRDEAARFTPGLDVRVLDATAKKRGSTVAEAIGPGIGPDGERRGTADVVITSYTLLRLDEDQFASLDWSGLVLDEAQFVKNRKARTHLAAKAIRAPFRLAITGTPMENSLTDLWALLSLTAPGLFPSPRAFGEEYVKPIESPDPSESGARRAASRMELLQRRIRPFVLRRSKDLVARDLPEKQEQVVTVPLSSAHRALYEKVLQRERQKLLGLAGDIDRNRFIVFRSLTLLRMLALDPSIVDPEHAHVPSSKLAAMLERLDAVIAEGHRVLIFSQFTSHLDHVAEELDRRGIGHVTLDGSATAKQRTAVVDRFRESDAEELPVFLISLKAGGFGLTLTEADYVFLLDPWWNPAAEAQAIDRIHRIGQQSPVFVYRMVAEGTIEEKVLALQERKRALFTDLTGEDRAFAEAITADDIRDLFAE